MHRATPGHGRVSSVIAGAPLTVLGVAPVAAAARLAVLLGAACRVAVRRQGDIVAFAAQGDAWRRDRAGLRAALARVASVSSFLPAEPSHAVCTAEEWPRMIAASAPTLSASLARTGWLRQWDVTVMSEAACACPGRVVAALREAMGCDGVDQPVLGTRVRGRRGGVSLSLLGEQGGQGPHAVLARLPGSLTAGCALSVEGPLPAFSFAGFRLERAVPEQVARAWALFALRDIADPAELARRWRGLAFALAPARAGRRGSARPLREAARAYDLLHHLSAGLGRERFARSDLLSLCGAPLALPHGPRWGHA